MKETVPKLIEHNDIELLKKYQEGNDEAFKVLFERYERQLIKYIFLKTTDLSSAKDICQETFLKLINSPPAFSMNDSLKPWIYRVASNKAIDFIRKRKIRTEKHPENHMEAEIPSHELIKKQEIDQIKNLIHQLPEDLKEIVQERVYNNSTFQQYSDDKAIPLGTALWRMKKAMQVLKEKFLRGDA